MGERLTGQRKANTYRTIGAVSAIAIWGSIGEIASLELPKAVTAPLIGLAVVGAPAALELSEKLAKHHPE